MFTDGQTDRRTDGQTDNGVSHKLDWSRPVELKIGSLRQNGHWESDFADVVPLALANVFKVRIRIFSSKCLMPVIDIEPDLTRPDPNKMIILAHLAIQWNEHYDAAIKPSNSQTTPDPQNSSEKTPEKNTSKGKTATPLITPHNAAHYVSPKKRFLSRKRQAKPQEWKANKRKKLRNQGKQYISKTGKTIAQKSVKKKDCSKCRFKCSLKVSEEERTQLFTLYWELGDYAQQRSFLCSSVSVSDTKRLSKETPKRTKALSYFFIINDKRERVCKDFFLKTLDIGKKTVDCALAKSEHGVFVGTDQRGRNTPGNKTPTVDENFIHRHIKSFPVVESHYTRKYSQRKYLAQDLSIEKMYKLYTEECKKAGRKPVKSKLYRRIFNHNYNLSFFKPKKDQCSVCTLHDEKKNNDTETPEMKQKFDGHQKRKEASRKEKARDKERAQKDKSYHVSTFDLEAVLSVPCSLVGELYYKRKLSCYNLSFYNLGNANGTCFLWDETQGGRGSCEVGTCLSLYINSTVGQFSPVQELTFYSDTCGGQNRNQYVVAALHHTMINSPYITTINQKYFESGHSQMESDSMHSAIENTKKCTKVYVPSQWETVVNLARKNKPYLVVPMKYGDFKDYKLLTKKVYKNMKVDTMKRRIQWQSVKWIQMRKSNPDSIFFNYGFDKEEFQEVCMKSATRSGRPLTDIVELQGRYEGKLPISDAKKKDLLSLCERHIIPETHWQYFKDLPTQRSVIDRIPMPDALESDQDTDEN